MAQVCVLVQSHAERGTGKVGGVERGGGRTEGHVKSGLGYV